MRHAPIRIHPDNPKIFEFRRRPTVLLCATEHYGAVMNRPFRFERYLADARDKEQTLTRLFTLFRELQSPINPYSTCKPESPDYISPFLRVGPELALDGQPKYDLDQWNPEFFDRLHRFMSLAQEYAIVVEVVLFSNTYCDSVWALNPINAKNNVNNVEEINFADYISTRHPKLFDYQRAHACKIVQELNQYDNIIFEICNEPGSENPVDPSAATVDEVNDWQCEIAQLIRQTEATLPNQHLISGQQAMHMIGMEYALKQIEGSYVQPSDLSFADFPVDIVNIHPLPNSTHGGRSYDLGGFMSKQLRLRPMREFCMDTYHQPKPLNMDEDNVASQYKDYDGWTIHRKRAWVTVMSGCHYDYIDFSIINYCETGTAESQRCIRSWMSHLSQFVRSVDLVNARPMRAFLKQLPEHTLDAVLAVAGRDYCIYLADERELDQPGAGREISGNIVLELPTGSYQMATFSPVTGLYSPWLAVEARGPLDLELPVFKHDLIVRIRKQGVPGTL